MQMPVESSDEVGQLTQAFNRMSEELRRTTVSKTELETLAGRLISAQEEERSRIARELHDDLTQRLAAVAIEAGRMEKHPESLPGDLRAGLERLKREMAQIADDVHGLSRRLHPAILDDLGLTAAVEAECRGVLERGGPWVDFTPQGDWSSVSRDTQLALYRIIQESLRNAHRHSGASEVTLRLQNTGSEAALEIRDNGQGFDRKAPGWRPGLGLASMEERTRLLGGTFAVHSQPGEGTVIRASIPANNTHGEDETPAS
jgi:signal transduction histidine kinase